MNVQSSFIARYSSLAFEPDFPGDLLFTGISQQAYKQNMAYAVQSDAGYTLGDQHTLRGGIFLQSDHSISDTASQVLAGGPTWVRAGSARRPTTIVDNGSATEWIYSAYLQDEWKPLCGLHSQLWPALRQVHRLHEDKQVSPRLNVVWQALDDTTCMPGYSRYLSPPPFELVGGKDITLFENTSSPPLTKLAAPPQAEHANYFDAGVQQKVVHGSYARPGYLLQAVQAI